MLLNMLKLPVGPELSEPKVGPLPEPIVYRPDPGRYGELDEEGPDAGGEGVFSGKEPENLQDTNPFSHRVPILRETIKLTLASIHPSTNQGC
jgi:hypothetical protein